MSELLNKYLASRNIAIYLDETELHKIADVVKRGYDIDEESRKPWLERMKKALKLAMLVTEEKNFPFKGSANVVYPMLTAAATQFASRAYPQIIKGNDVVKGKVVGRSTAEKTAKAARVGKYMSYQCLEEMEEWEDHLDAALTALPILGCVFKKTYYCSTRGRNVSEYRSPENVVINYFAKSVDDAPRITDRIELYPNEIRERQLSGVFLDMELGESRTRISEDADSADDEDQSHVFLEQHCWLDLDDDGLKEPYIVTLHQDSEKVVRVVARYRGDRIQETKDGKVMRIIPEQYFTQYPFMKSPDGGIYCMGFGDLLNAMGETVNTTINQLLDAGTLANSQTGFIGRGLSLGRGRGGGNIEFTMGEWKDVQYTGDDLRKNIVPLPVREPSGVLFNLLGFMVTAGEKITSVSEVLTGDQSIHNEPATTTLARIEQGLKVFSAIYKRVYRGMKSEFKKLFRLNYIYLNPETYFTVMDEEDQSVVYLRDFDSSDIDCVPVADPAEVSDTQKLLKSEILMSMMNMPGLDNQKILQRRLEALNIPDAEDLFSTEAPPPDPKIELEKAKLALEQERLRFEMSKWGVESVEKKSIIIKNLAEAEAKELGTQLDKYKTDMDALVRKEKIDADRARAVSGVASQSGNKGSAQGNAGAKG